MYDDQATKLRDLIFQSAAARYGRRPNTPRILVLIGGKSGVGTTTVALNLARVFAGQGRRTVIVDADPRRGELQSICLPGQDQNYGTAADDTPGHRRINPADREPSLATISAGLNLLVAPWVRRGHSNKTLSLAEINRFSHSLANLGEHSEYVVVDAGNGVSAEARSLWAAADTALVITTPESISIMDCYTVVKSIVDAPGCPRITAIVNQSPHANVSLDVFRRLDQSSQRFLGQSLTFAGAIPVDPLLANPTDETTAALLRSPSSSAVRALEQVVRHVQASNTPSAERLA